LVKDLEVEETRKEEGASEMINELPDLIGANGNEAFVTAVLAVFLFEYDARNATYFALLGGNVLPGISAGNREDGFVVLRVGFWKTREVGEWL
jgi:hypothetical protein